jgi:hypothetical protein
LQISSHQMNNSAAECNHRRRLILPSHIRCDISTWMRGKNFHKIPRDLPPDVLPEFEAPSGPCIFAPWSIAMYQARPYGRNSSLSNNGNAASGEIVL